MITFKQYLTEKFFAYMKGYGSSPTEIILDGSLKEVHDSLWKKTPKFNVRGIVDAKGNLYLWDAVALLHDDATHKISNGRIFFNVTADITKNAITAILYVSTNHSGLGAETQKAFDIFMDSIRKNRIKITQPAIDEYTERISEYE